MPSAEVGVGLDLPIVCGNATFFRARRWVDARNALTVLGFHAPREVSFQAPLLKNEPLRPLRRH
jgi:hypothetical protein